MGSWIEALTSSESGQAQEMLQKVPGWFEEWEQILSRFRLDSELSKLNRLSGQPVLVSQVLWDVLQISMQAAEESNGLVTPAILDALEYAGYDRSFEKLESFSSLRNPFLTMPSIEQIICDKLSRTVILPEGLRLDFGGSAKGWAAHQAVQRLAEAGPVLVNAGGDIAISKTNKFVQPWEIGILNPFQPDKDIKNIEIQSGGVATSGIDHRKWMQNGIVRHHIIDPRTNLPTETDILSATIIADNVMEAEMASKASLLLGSTDGLSWLEGHPQLSGFLIRIDGSIHQTGSFEQYLRSENGRKVENKSLC